MLKRLVALILAAIAGVLIVRTWRFDHAPTVAEDLGQYLHDRFEVDDRFLRSMRVDSLALDPGTLENVLKTFSTETGVPVVVRWERLAPFVRPQTHVEVLVKSHESVASVLSSILRAAGVNEIDSWGQRFWVCRHGTIVITGPTRGDADLAWRSYPVGDLMEMCRASGIDASKIASYAYPHPVSDDDKFLATVHISTWQNHSIQRSASGITSLGGTLGERLNGGMLEVHITLEQHIVLYTQLQELRKQWIADPTSIGQVVRTPPSGFRW